MFDISEVEQRKDLIIAAFGHEDGVFFSGHHEVMCVVMASPVLGVVIFGLILIPEDEVFVFFIERVTDAEEHE